MGSISQTIRDFNAMRDGFDALLGDHGRLTSLSDFGSNPGDLDAFCYIPADLPPASPLVVVLHGCGQNAAGYDSASGWSALADRAGFALLFPQQRAANNPNRCFNWFTRSDTKRDSGEALSIRQMVDAMVVRHAIDTTRIFVTGLSAGGAMTSVMLATYPELFAGGAIIAGLPYGTALGVQQALDRMKGQGGPDRDALPDLVRDASSHRGVWPRISLWHGTADTTVVPANAEAILSQWRTLHGVADRPAQEDSVDGYPHRIWTDAKGRAVIEEYSITNMGHGTPLSTRGEEALGQAAPYMLEVGISSTHHIADFWGIAARPKPNAAGRVGRQEADRKTSGNGVAAIIERALRSAGLMS
ncbi:extracellular catalytic domain type 1 short-chain-length polyhydroxyalkanoate depolymerase [Stakelama pacifica]|uniref:Poly(Hydroxyalkanoate) depolymerase family esterase n=1 Tax=Stakelama pacifica TaxID=517720 RepID=A0A4R6FIH5_9SPHN|nr:PHB depolymerase family esterase [Stakelama pacifica]TDN81186.1 poly(hydroxyalkanoate) depolymerase family esterase [Stakelama pacifica]GGO97005.1 LpqC, poly [Stakelama pacifica]